LAGLTYGEPQIVERFSDHAFPTTVKTVVNRHEPMQPTIAHSLDELPPTVRAQVEAMQERVREAGPAAAREAKTVRRITFKGPDGQVHVFNSPEEMPPDIRALYERARNTRE